MGFYLHHTGLWCIYQCQSQKFFISLKDINKPLLYAKFQKDWFETVENRGNSKSISDSGIWCNER